MRFRRSATLFALVCSAWACAGCLDHERSSFKDIDPAIRLRAVHAAGEAGDRGAIPHLIVGLLSDDPAERLFSIRTLERLTGQTLGYEHSAPRPERLAAAERWQVWYASQDPATDRPPAPPTTERPA